MEDCSNSSALALELLQSHTKSSVWHQQKNQTEIHFLSSKSLKVFTYIYTVECYYNAVQYNKILHTSLQGLRQNINQRLNLQKNNPYLALTGKLRSVFCEYIWENWLHYNGTALCIYFCRSCITHQGAVYAAPMSCCLGQTSSTCCAPLDEVHLH